jgi:hypothetical protein
MLHGDIARAVWDAYRWDDADPTRVADDDIVSRLLRLNVDRSL